VNDTNRLEQLVAIVKNMRAAQRDYWAKGRTTVVECKRLEAACDRWLEMNGFAEAAEDVSGGNGGVRRTMNANEFVQHVRDSIELLEDRLKSFMEVGEAQQANQLRAIARISASLSSMAKSTEREYREADEWRPDDVVALGPAAEVFVHDEERSHVRQA
jgi:hypothetical protein